MKDSSLLEMRSDDKPFSRNPADSYTMPSRFYTSTEVFELEKEAIFAKTWHYAGHVSQVSQKGSYFTTSIHEQNLFVTRGRDDELRGFSMFVPIEDMN